MEQQLDSPIKPNYSINDSRPDLQSNEDEIDLMQLLVSLYSVFKKNLILLSATILLLVCVGIAGVNFMYPLLYKTSFIAHSKNVPISQISLLVTELQQVAEQGNPADLAKLINITEEQAADIQSFSLIDAGEKADNAKFFSLQVFTFKNEPVDDLDDKIITYFNSRPFIKERYELEVKKLQENIEDLSEELKKLESMQDNLNGMLSNINSGKAMLNTNVHLQDLSSISERIVGMKYKKNSYEYELQRLKEVELIQGIMTAIKGRQVSFLKLIALVIFGSVVVGIGVVGIKEFGEYANKKMA